MSKAAVIYWSGTGNTEAMANAVLDGTKQAGAEAQLYEAGAFDPAGADSFDGFALGCPSMGVEELEDGVFLPMFEQIKDKLSGKKVALFGSYGWGDGEWMRTWEEDCRQSGIALSCDSVICNEAPNDRVLEQCRALGRAIA